MSLLLDALKKAAQEKIEKQKQADNPPPEPTEFDTQFGQAQDGRGQDATRFDKTGQFEQTLGKSAEKLAADDTVAEVSSDDLDKLELVPEESHAAADTVAAAIAQQTLDEVHADDLGKIDVPSSTPAATPVAEETLADIPSEDLRENQTRFDDSAIVHKQAETLMDDASALAADETRFDTTGLALQEDPPSNATEFALDEEAMQSLQASGEQSSADDKSPHTQIDLDSAAGVLGAAELSMEDTTGRFEPEADGAAKPSSHRASIFADELHALEKTDITDTSAFNRTDMDNSQLAATGSDHTVFAFDDTTGPAADDTSNAAGNAGQTMSATTAGGNQQQAYSSSSMTHNYAQQLGYGGSAQQAAHLFANKKPPNNNNAARWALLALLGFAVVFFSVLYIWDYVGRINDQSAITNVAARKVARPLTTSSSTTEQNLSAIVPDDDVDPELLIEQENYQEILEETLLEGSVDDAVADAIANASNTDSAGIAQRNTAASASPPPPAKAVAQTARRTDNPVNPGELSINKTPRKRESLQQILMQGYDAYNQGAFADAKVAYERALRRSPTSRDALLGLAAVEFQQGRPEQARVHYQRLLEMNPRDEYALAGLKSTQTSVSTNSIAVQSDLSESQLKLMLAENPESAQLHFTLANGYAENKQWAKAQQAYFDAFRLESNNPDYAYNLAVSLDHLSQQAAASRFYQQALSLAEQYHANFDRDTAASRVLVLQKD